MSDNEMEHFMRMWMSQQAERREAKFRKLREEILPVLKKVNVSQVVMDYDGEGDSTNDATLSYSAADGTAVDRRTNKWPFDENELIHVLFEAVPDGYENNEGGYGQVILNVGDGKVRVEHCQRRVESDYFEEEYEV